MTLCDLLENRSREYHDKTFLFVQDLEVSYGVLEETACRVANGLAGLGIKKRTNVCILLPNCPEFLYAFFGIMKAGAVAVPINFNLKGEEIKYILNNSEATALITAPGFLETIRQIRSDCSSLSHIILTGSSSEAGAISFTELSKTSGRAKPVPLKGSDPAAIIYTSGTTGYPKGVVLTHRNYLFDTEQFVAATQMNQRDRFLCILPLFHVNGQVVTTLSPMFAGGSMVLMEKFSPKDFFPTLARFKATAFSGVPTVYAILLNLPDAEQYDLSSLRFCVCGAAPMPVELFQNFEKKFNAFILEGYGLSEGTCVSSVNPLGGHRKIGSIGLPLPHQEMKVVDDQDRELESGQVGEIVVRGENVMREYFKNLQATTETLRGGWLHTGDLGYEDHEGYFYIVGRKKEMIIRGGENIYPKEIEEVLYRHPKVLEAAVIGLPDRIWGEEVCAFIVLKEGIQGSLEEFMEYCKSRLADFKCPRKVVFWGQFPKTATGKIQKGKLKEEYLAKSDGGGV
jgi:long-chain acyl-CoA synthetase